MIYDKLGNIVTIEKKENNKNELLKEFEEYNKIKESIILESLSLN